MSNIKDGSKFGVDIEFLEKKSAEITEYIIDEKTEDFTKHFLPLKNYEGFYLKEDNWNLPEEDKNKIIKNNQYLTMYAGEVLNEINLNKVSIENIDFILPPWIVFPLYPSGTIGWRMGVGEAYEEIFYNWLNSMEKNYPEKLKEYKEIYKRPSYFDKRLERYDRD